MVGSVVYVVLEESEQIPGMFIPTVFSNADKAYERARMLIALGKKAPVYLRFIH